MRITLNTWERVQLALVVGSGRGTFEQIELGLRALEILRLSDVEKKAIGYFELGPGQLAWTKDQEYGLEFDDRMWQLIAALVRSYQAWPTDERVRSLREKIVDGRE